jgi:hypothetical protein
MAAEVVGIAREDKDNSTVNYTHSIKIEETAKGIRFHVHVFGTGGEETGLDALKTYENTVNMFKKNGHIIAPMIMNGASKCTQ